MTPKKPALSFTSSEPAERELTVLPQPSKVPLKGASFVPMGVQSQPFKSRSSLTVIVLPVKSVPLFTSSASPASCAVDLSSKRALFSCPVYHDLSASSLECLFWTVMLQLRVMLLPSVVVRVTVTGPLCKVEETAVTKPVEFTVALLLSRLSYVNVLFVALAGWKNTVSCKVSPTFRVLISGLRVILVIRTVSASIWFLL